MDTLIDAQGRDHRDAARGRALHHIEDELRYIQSHLSTLRDSSEARAAYRELKELEKKLSDVTRRAGKLMEELP